MITTASCTRRGTGAPDAQRSAAEKALKGLIVVRAAHVQEDAQRQAPACELLKHEVQPCSAVARAHSAARFQ